MHLSSPRNESGADLTDCAREPIHIPGAIQPHGLLLVLDEADLTIRQASANLKAVTGRAAEDVAGEPAALLFGEELSRLLHAWIRREELELVTPFERTLLLGEPPRPFDAVAHRTAGGVVLELEPAPPRDPTQVVRSALQLQQSIERLRQARGIAGVCEAAAYEVRRLTGFDRVKVYRFEEDWHGEVIAESRAEHMDSFLGLHFPASDIPEQARRLYTINRHRVIASVDYTPAPLVPRLNPATGELLDMSRSVLRSVSPVHLEYLRNMGVGASMSISIVREETLWGMIACHHAAPLNVSFEIRAQCEIVGQALALLLASKEEEAGWEQLARIREAQSRLLEAMVRTDDFIQGLSEHADLLLEITGARGVAIWSQGEAIPHGATPPKEGIRQIVDWLSAQPAFDVFETDRLAHHLPAAEAFRETGSGLLALSVSRLRPAYFLWFRPEQPKTVYWAGNPNKPVTTDGEGEHHLHPRRSFAAWKETVRGRSHPWRAFEVNAAKEFRRALVDVVFARTEQLARLNASLERSNQTLQHRNEELQNFAYIASHDLQEPLRKIRAFGSLLTDEYQELLDEQGRFFLNRIDLAAEHMSMLISDLLTYSRVLTHANPFEPTRLAEPFEEARRDLSLLIEETGATVEVGELPTIQADPGQMRRLFQNLLSNALRFRKPGVPPRIRVAGTIVELPRRDARSSAASRLICRITVEDNGIGFDEKYLDRIFRPFERLHGSNRYDGTGIGLAVCRRIAERHGGQITARSTPGEGSTFIVEMPTGSTADE